MYSNNKYSLNSYSFAEDINLIFVNIFQSEVVSVLQKVLEGADVSDYLAIFDA